MKKKVQIIIVDDNLIFLDGITTFLSKMPDYEIAACFQSGIDLLENLGRYQADLILLDIEMPVLNGIETAKRLNYLKSSLILIAISLYNDQVYIKQLIEAGFRGFVSKNNVSEELPQVIESVLNNRFVFPHEGLKLG